jgi:uncharacterized protein
VEIMSSLRRSVPTILAAIWLGSVGLMQAAHADALARGLSAYSRGDYVRAVRDLSPEAWRGNPKAQAILGFLFENGFGTPQSYEIAADLYHNAALQGNPFAQCMLGLLYDKGHGVPQDVILAYKWLVVGAAHAPKRERDYYLRLRDAVSSKMSAGQIVEGQRLASSWAPLR